MTCTTTATNGTLVGTCATNVPLVGTEPGGFRA